MDLKKFVTCEEAAEIIGCSGDHVRLLLRQGVLVGEKWGGSTWLVERRSCDLFRKNRPKRGRPRNKISANR